MVWLDGLELELRQGLGCGSSVASLPLGVEFANLPPIVMCRIGSIEVGAEVQLIKIN